MSRTLFSLAGFQVITIGRFWVIAEVRDADDNPADAFTAACSGFEKPFKAPHEPFTVVHEKARRTGVFLTPSRNRTGTLEHLLFDAIRLSHPEMAEAVGRLEASMGHIATWEENKQAKMRMQCAVACSCEDDPSCSLGFIWHKRDNPIDINSPAFGELVAFLQDFTA